jgi:hypothetical protein
VVEEPATDDAPVPPPDPRGLWFADVSAEAARAMLLWVGNMCKLDKRSHFSGPQSRFSLAKIIRGAQGMPRSILDAAAAAGAVDRSDLQSFKSQKFRAWLLRLFDYLCISFYPTQTFSTQSFAMRVDTHDVGFYRTRRLIPFEAKPRYRCFSEQCARRARELGAISAYQQERSKERALIKAKKLGLIPESMKTCDFSLPEDGE